MKNNSFLLIINPMSGKKQGFSYTDVIVNFFKNHQILLDVFYTEYKGHAKNYIHDIDSNIFSSIIIYGGDGTFNEVINGLLSRKDKYLPALGFLPGGSGNSVMYHLNKLDIKKACEMIVKNQIINIDVMNIQYNNKIEYSINMLGWGMVTDIGLLAEKIRWLGPIRYNIASLIYIFNKKNRYANIIIDGLEYPENYLFVLIANTKYTGKGMMIAPNAKLDDGFLDLIVLKNNITKFELMKLLPQLFTGKHITSSYVDYHQVNELQIVPKINETLNIDGEIYGRTPVMIKVLKNILPIYYY